MQRPVIQEKTWNTVLFVDKPEIPSHIQEEAKQLELRTKDEYHISIFVSANARKIRDAALNKYGEKGREELEKLLGSLSWEYKLLNKYYLHENTYTKDELEKNGYSDLTEHTRRTIVQLVEIPSIAAIYERVKNHFDISLPRTVPHITLFYWSSYNNYPGIGVNSEEEFNKFTKREIMA